MTDEAAGLRAMISRGERLTNPGCDALRMVAESIARKHAATIDGEFGCCHDEGAFLAGGRVSEFDEGEFEPIPDDCPGKRALDRHLADIGAACGASPGAIRCLLSSHGLPHVAHDGCEGFKPDLVEALRRFMDRTHPHAGADQ